VGSSQPLQQVRSWRASSSSSVGGGSISQGRTGLMKAQPMVQAGAVRLPPGGGLLTHTPFLRVWFVSSLANAAQCAFAYKPFQTVPSNWRHLHINLSTPDAPPTGGGVQRGCTPVVQRVTRRDSVCWAPHHRHGNASSDAHCDVHSQATIPTAGFKTRSSHRGLFNSLPPAGAQWVPLSATLEPGGRRAARPIQATEPST
jgi:hypothetical protein